MKPLYEKADERGVPSLVWRAGQERRLRMILTAAEGRLNDVGKVLVDGCGIGMYNKALLPYTPWVYGLDIEFDRVLEAATIVPYLSLARGETLPYPENCFDLVLSHEVIEHVQDDRRYAAELVRALKPGGRGIIFCPNRLYPFETHGHYWRGQYHFGNTPLINYLPDSARDRLAPHVRAYTQAGLQNLFWRLPVKIIKHTQIYPGYDNIIHRWPIFGRLLRGITHALERTPFRVFGLSHVLIVEKR